MEKLVSNWSNIQSVPENYIFPPETRPGEDLKVPFSHSIPIIDLNDRTNTTQQIIKAAREFGFFQETMSVFKQVFQMPDEYKHSSYLDDDLKTCKIFTSSLRYETEKVHLWRDSLRHPSHPLEQWQHLWPQNPITYRECVGNFSVKIKDLGSRILDLISEGLDLKCGYFDNDLTGSMIISVNHYPPCPKPSLTLGLPKHKDPYLITILMQDGVSGLQVLKDATWVAVEPLPHAFVINIGHLLEIISKGKLISAEHRAVTNSSHTRTSAAFFIAPSDDCLIEPAQDISDENDHPILKSFKYKEFLKEFFNAHGDTDLLLKSLEAPKN
ncbi:hyoscyamine 6-dioxygenase isoform X2 [Lathyrus oleraceus]|uniref:hyoscyamine 6-dioxygenase isoform X2 n=1 Tax=Pisum sativum TaxID=3888 RepID=UPI0021D31ABD|nr:hyoscyamine 6-dioxygenase-like isoform X2 [Pisum sativum]